MEEKRNITISLKEAREWYKSNNKALREIALKAYSENELFGYFIGKVTSHGPIVTKLGDNIAILRHETAQDDTFFDTYEDVLEEGLKQALKLI